MQQEHKFHATTAVVTSNEWLASNYDAHPKSMALTSNVLSPAKAQEMFAKGLLQQVLFLNGEGAQLLEQIKNTSTKQPNIIKLDTQAKNEDLIETIHSEFVSMG